MPLVTTTEMFKKAYAGKYAIGAFNVNNMEMIQAIVEAANEEKSPVILQVSAGARKYANPVYLKHLVQAAVETNDIPIAMHLDHGADFEICKASIDGGFTSVMIDASSKPWDENIAITKKVVEYAHDHGVVVEAELGTLAGIEDDVNVSAEHAHFTSPTKWKNSPQRRVSTPLQSQSAPLTALTSLSPVRIPSFVLTSSKKSARDCPASPSFCTALPPFLRTRLPSSTNLAVTCPTQSVFPNPSLEKRRRWRFAKSTSTLTFA